MEKQTNFEHLRTLSPRSLARAIIRIVSDICVCCPREMERRCNEDCESGLTEWMDKDYHASSDVWKKKGRK